jgi:hypothetical protein
MTKTQALRRATLFERLAERLMAVIQSLKDGEYDSEYGENGEDAEMPRIPEAGSPGSSAGDSLKAARPLLRPTPIWEFQGDPDLDGDPVAHLNKVRATESRTQPEFQPAQPWTDTDWETGL